jgi:hypothetical protein
VNAAKERINVEDPNIKWEYDENRFWATKNGSFQYTLRMFNYSTLDVAVSYELWGYNDTHYLTDIETRTIYLTIHDIEYGNGTKANTSLYISIFEWDNGLVLTDSNITHNGSISYEVAYIEEYDIALQDIDYPILVHWPYGINMTTNDDFYVDFTLSYLYIVYLENRFVPIKDWRTLELILITIAVLITVIVFLYIYVRREIK